MKNTISYVLDGELEVRNLVNYKRIENYAKYRNFSVAKFKVMKEHDLDKLFNLFHDFFFTIKYLEFVFKNTLSTGVFKYRITCLIHEAKTVYRLMGDVIYNNL